MTTTTHQNNSNIQSLADLTDTMPVDGPTGAVLRDSNGRADQPDDYEVLDHVKTEDGFRALVRGPSNQVDLVTDDATGSRIYRDCGLSLLSEADAGI